VSTTRFARVTDVVWRSGPDRVLIQRIGGPSATAATDLIGDVAYVWLALDLPATRGDVLGRLADAGVGVADVDRDLRYLVEHDLITETR
jgi:hypothetical protein